MTDLRTAAQQALTLLELVSQAATKQVGVPLEIVDTLRAALAEPVQEPVQQGCDHCNHPLYAAVKCRVCGRRTEPVQEQPICDECGRKKADGWALYCVDCMEPVFAPPQRPPLSDEEIQNLSQQHRFDSRMEKFVRIIEAAHGIKEGT